MVPRVASVLILASGEVSYLRSFGGRYHPVSIMAWTILRQLEGIRSSSLKKP